MSLLIKQVQKAKRIGAQNEPQDSILAHISPKEASLLKRLGGSGDIDPMTGLPHFRESDSGTSGGMNRGGGNDRGGGGSGNQGDGSKESDKEKADAAQAAKDAADAATSAVQNTNTTSAISDNIETQTDINGNQIPAREAITSEQAHYPGQTTTGYGVKNALAAVGAILDPEPISKALLAGYAKTKHTQTEALNANGYFNDNNSLKSRGNGDGTGNGNGGNASDLFYPTKAPVQNETETAPAATPATANAFDEFSTKARKRKGYMSTLLSGGLTGATPQGKVLLGS